MKAGKSATVLYFDDPCIPAPSIFDVAKAIKFWEIFKNERVEYMERKQKIYDQDIALSILQGSKKTGV